MSDLSQYIKPASDPIKEMPGTYADEVEAIPDGDRFTESTLPKASDPSPFKIGPL